MFTGLIQDIGTVKAIERGDEGARVRIATSLTGNLVEGDSVAVNGACLTAISVDGGAFATEAMNQTLDVTAIGGLETGSRVNLELAMRVGDRLGGHIVQGHVDGVGEVAEVVEDGFARRVRVALPGALMRYVIERGSVALDGVSLTVARLGDDWVEVSLIPETLERTTLGEAGTGRRLNVECDLVAKYVERLVTPFAGKDRT